MSKEYLPVEFEAKPITRAEQLREQTEEVKDHLKEVNHNPIHALASKAKLLSLELEQGLEDFDQRMAIEKLLFEHNKELASYIAPKLKSVDVSGQINQGVTVILGLQNQPSILLQDATPTPLQIKDAITVSDEDEY